jgi:hypothetical protein
MIPVRARLMIEGGKEGKTGEPKEYRKRME